MKLLTPEQIEKFESITPVEIDKKVVGQCYKPTENNPYMNFTLGDLMDNPDSNAEIYGALTLYLDFINLFLNLLQLFGDRK